MKLSFETDSISPQITQKHGNTNKYANSVTIRNDIPSSIATEAAFAYILVTVAQVVLA